MFLVQWRDKLLVPELELVVLRERTHIVNHRRFFSHHRIYLGNKIDNFRSVSPQRGILPVLEGLDKQESLMIVLSPLTKDFEAQLIRVRRAYVERRFGKPKSKASKAPVPMYSLLAAHFLPWRRETLYPAAEDLVFPSLRLKGKKPPAANMLVADYLRVAARKAGVIAPPGTFGFHTFRRTLASVLVNMKVDIKTVQEILRHQNLKTTLEIYAKAMSEAKLEAQGMFLEKLFSQDQKKKSPKDVVSAKDLERIEPVVSSLQ
jgi:integrase